MADVTIAGGVVGLTENRDAFHGPYWKSPSVGYAIFQEAQDIEVWKTADSGATWTQQDQANEPGDSNNRSISVWFDQETPGNNGNIIHIAFVITSSNTSSYVQFDTSDDTFGTIRTVDSLTISNTSTDSDIAVTVSKSKQSFQISNSHVIVSVIK